MKSAIVAAIIAFTILLAACTSTSSRDAGPSSSAPRYQVDPFWPKPLPNQWALGQVAGLHVDGKDHL